MKNDQILLYCCFNKINIINQNKTFYNIINHKHVLTKYYNHQEHTYCYLGGCKNTMLEQKLLKQITKIKY